MSKPIVSIIIPVRDEEKVIEKTIRQFEVLTIPHEIILSDGGSSDKTVEIARKFTNKIAPWNGPGRQTIAAGRNAGAALAEGEFLCYFDADCRISELNDFFQIALARFTADPKLIALTGNVAVEPALASVADKIVWGMANCYNRFVNNIWHGGGACGEFQFFRKSAFLAVHGYRADLTAREDYDIYIRMAKIGKTRFVPTLTVYHSGRHSRQVGWPKLLWQWWVVVFWYRINGRSHYKEWQEVR